MSLALTFEWFHTSLCSWCFSCILVTHHEVYMSRSQNLKHSLIFSSVPKTLATPSFCCPGRNLGGTSFFLFLCIVFSPCRNHISRISPKHVEACHFLTALHLTCLLQCTFIFLPEILWLLHDWSFCFYPWHLRPIVNSSATLILFKYSF